ncbi:MAG: hypothetical protein MJ252_11405 [archaeon]|nr:hypothetical protein [archaeon]
MTYFDMHILIYDGIKPDYESRLSLQVRIDQIHEIGLIKNHKTPFFILKDNRTPYLFPYSKNTSQKLSALEEQQKNKFNSYSNYKFYLPRINASFNIPLRPEIEYFFKKNRNGLNELSKFNPNPLIAEDGKLDWFIYDEESIHFLMEMNKIKFEQNPNIKFLGGKVYFEDKCERLKIKDDELKKFFINITMVFMVPSSPTGNEIITRKMAMTSNSCAYELISSFCRKCGALKSEFRFNPDDKILKVKGLNDYIFDIKRPLLEYTYINECLKENREANYVIIDNPAKIKAEPNRLERGETRSSVYLKKDLYYNDRQFESLLNLATYDQGLDIDYRKTKMSGTDFYSKVQSNFYSKEGGKTQLNKPSNDALNKFMTDLEFEMKNQKTSEINELKKKQEEETKNPSKQTNSPTNQKFMNYIPVDLNSINKIICKDISNALSSKNSLFQEKKSNVLKTGINRSPNVFKTGVKEGFNVKNLIEKYSSPIEFKNMNRTFMIKFINAQMGKFFNSYPFDKFKKEMVLIFKLQLFCGAKPFSKAKQVKYTAKENEFILPFNLNVNFEVNCQNIPNYCSLSFKVKMATYDKTGAMDSLSTIMWVNFRLFDHNKQLRTGVHKLGLYEKEFSADSPYCVLDEMEEDASTLTFEIESFASVVDNKGLKLNPYDTDYSSVKIGVEEKRKFDEIRLKTPFEDLNKVEKDLLWNNRYYLTKYPELISKMVNDFNFTDYKNLIELEKFFQKAEILPALGAIDLLSGKYLNESIRNYAVKCIKKSSIIEVHDYLLQLVQGLKYEMDHDSELARYILQLSVRYPTTIGHSLFWSLKSELYNQNVQQRFGLYLEIFLYKIGPELSKIFFYEDFLVKHLLSTADIGISGLEKEEMNKRFTEKLELLNAYLSQTKYEVSIPLNFKYNVTGVDISKCKFMKSKKKPLWLTFKNSDPVGEDIVVMFKKGDDLRMDIVTLQLFKAMQTMWFNNSIKLKMSIYKVMCTGYNQGMLEMVTNSETLASIQFKDGGALSTLFSKSALKKWLDNNCIVNEEEREENFLLSNVAYCAATFVLGVGDRHNDNIMVKKNGELFHIDFGHFLGHFKYKLGIKRERAPFVFTKEFQHVLGGETGERYKRFTEIFWKCYKILRKNANNIVSMLRILLCTGIPELDEKSIKFLAQSLALKMDDEAAHKFLNDKINESLNCLSTKFNFAIHIFATK